MKHFLQKAIKIKSSLHQVTLIACILLLFTSCKKEPQQPVLKISTVASGFTNPIGLEIDKSGGIWVAQSGSGHDDGKVIVIKDGQKYDMITGFPSVSSDGGEPDGPTHLLFADGLLYVLGTGGKMYKADPAALKPGGTPLKASSLGVENIGAYMLGQGFADTHPYNLTVGPNGAIYITDAAANAIIRREKTGALSVLAKVPGIPNPTPIGPPSVESVPTGIYYDGQNFLVTTLLGYPFPAGKAIIYKVSPTGVLSVYQQGFTSLVDIAEGGSLGRLVLGHGTFGGMGWNAKTGSLTWANGTTATVLTSDLNLPAGLKQADAHTWYVTSIGDGSVLKVTY